jgi:preprotein translocase subunit YajC
MIDTIHLLMQATQPADPGAPGRAAPGLGALLSSPMTLLLLLLGVFWFMMFRGNRREKQKKEALLNSIGRNDRVLTIGGIIGTVVQVKGDEIVVKIDESTNTKMNMLRSAVRQVLDRDETPSEVPK